MNKYSQLLQDQRWKQRRLEIIQRDGGKCQQCSSTERLHVHHLWYEPSIMPWEASDEDLITLCHICHAVRHEYDKKFVKVYDFGEVLVELSVHDGLSGKILVWLFRNMDIHNCCPCLVSELAVVMCCTTKTIYSKFNRLSDLNLIRVEKRSMGKHVHVNPSVCNKSGQTVFHNFGHPVPVVSKATIDEYFNRLAQSARARHHDGSAARDKQNVKADNMDA